VFFIRLGGNPAIFEDWGKIETVSINRILTLEEKETLPKTTLFGRVGGTSRARPLPREVHLIVIGPNGRELEAGPPGPVKDKPAGGDLGTGLSSPHTPRN
jgi:hypothetical protein